MKETGAQVAESVSRTIAFSEIIAVAIIIGLLAAFLIYLNHKMWENHIKQGEHRWEIVFQSLREDSEKNFEAINTLVEAIKDNSDALAANNIKMAEQNIKIENLSKQIDKL